MTEAGRGRPTIYDVAREAGVSIGTVSKALNDTGRLSDETRSKVSAAADALGFLPAYRRRPSRGGQRVTIGVVTTDSYGRFTIPVILGAEDAFARGRASVLMCDARDDPIREEFYLDSLLRQGVDALIVTGKSYDPRPSLSSFVDVPVVYVLQPSEEPADCSVVPDDHQAAALAVEHFRASDRTRIAHVTGPSKQRAASLRRDAVLEALNAVGLSLAGETVYGEWSERSGREAAEILARRGIQFDAVYCGSDQIGRGIIDGLRQASCHVPKDVAVIGIDNWDVIVEASNPPLTSVDLELRELGAYAAQLLASAVAGHALPSGIITRPCTLVPRGSTGTG
jgi:LacI family transcriptional regulator